MSKLTVHGDAPEIQIGNLVISYNRYHKRPIGDLSLKKKYYLFLHDWDLYIDLINYKTSSTFTISDAISKEKFSVKVAEYLHVTA